MTVSQRFITAVLLTALSVFSFSAQDAVAEIELGAPFTDNAILQREMNVPVWGWSKPATKVTIEFAGQKKTTVTGDDGKWMLQLDPLKASAEPAELKVSAGTGATHTLKNILVGEVWLASGQSNMQWIASKCDVGRVLMKRMAERVAAGKEKEPVIREALVTNYFASLHPIEHADVDWSPAGGNSSAIAYAFAYKLHRELGVPIGILNCSFSQTSIQAWTPGVGFADGQDAYTQAIYKKILETAPTTPEHKAAWAKFYINIETTLKENEARVNNGEHAQAISTKTPGNLSGNRDASWLFNARLNPMIPYAIRGGIWNQGYANIGEGLVYYNNLHSLIRGWRKLWNRPELPVYFHQFYCPGHKGGWNHDPTIGGATDMRLGTWLARDIPHTGMASQIDITGAIHYGNKALPGQRLALHAIKNQYGKDIIADGPMFKSYEVKGNKLIISFDHAEGGLVVAETGTNSKSGLATPTIILSGDAQVKCFYLADKNRVWHPASMKIDGETVVLSSPKVKSPRGVSYGTAGIGFQPNLYNRAMLPTTPFIYYDQKLVTSKTWPDEKLKVAGEVIDPSTVGKLAEWYKMPLLSTQFRDNAVFQAGVPITIWGSVLHDYGYEAEGKATIKFSFAGIEKKIAVNDNSPNIVKLGPGQSRAASGKEWRVTVPPMKANAEPKTLKVSFFIDGEVAHERVCKNIVIGDVWFVAAPPGKFNLPSTEKSNLPVRMMTRKAKRFTFHAPSRYTVCVSRTPKNRFASEWTDANGMAATLGNRISSTTGKPVGIVFMQSGMTSMGKGVPSKNLTGVKSWIPVDDLKNAPSLLGDYKDLATVRPGNPFYDANVRRYVSAWKKYWSETIPKLMATKRVPDAAPWGSYPTLTASVTSKASETYNVMAHSFTPGAFKGVIFLCSEQMFAEDQGANYGSELTALANCWKRRFGGEDPQFIYTIPNQKLAQKITRPKSINGESTPIEIGDWFELKNVIQAVGH